jgi:hypothetical protein
MNNIFKNQDIRGIILSKKKQMNDEEVLLELLLNESHFRHKIMLAEIKYHIEMNYTCNWGIIKIEDNLKEFYQSIVYDWNDGAYWTSPYPYYDPDTEDENCVCI